MPADLSWHIAVMRRNRSEQMNKANPRYVRMDKLELFEPLMARFKSTSGKSGSMTRIDMVDARLVPTGVLPRKATVGKLFPCNDCSGWVWPKPVLMECEVIHYQAIKL